MKKILKAIALIPGIWGMLVILLPLDDSVNELNTLLEILDVIKGICLLLFSLILVYFIEKF